MGKALNALTSSSHASNKEVLRKTSSFWVGIVVGKVSHIRKRVDHILEVASLLYTDEISWSFQRDSSAVAAHNWCCYFPRYSEKKNEFVCMLHHGISFRQNGLFGLFTYLHNLKPLFLLIEYSLWILESKGMRCQIFYLIKTRYMLHYIFQRVQWTCL